MSSNNRPLIIGFVLATANLEIRADRIIYVTDMGQSRVSHSRFYPSITPLASLNLNFLCIFATYSTSRQFLMRQSVPGGSRYETFFTDNMKMHHAEMLIIRAGRIKSTVGSCRIWTCHGAKTW